MKKALITGTNGFIGKNLVKELTSQFDIVELNEDDIFNGDNWCLLLSDKLNTIKPDVIFHVGACSDTLETDVNYMMTRNFESTKIMADYCKFNDVKMIYSSSAASYGVNNEYPSNLYGWSKYIAEQYVISNNGLALRYFNVYGPGEEHKGRMASIVYQTIKRQKNGEDIKLFPGKPMRDFIYVKDIVKANILAYHCFYSHRNNYYDIGVGTERTFEDILKCLGIEDYTYFNEKDIPKGYQFHTKANSENFMKGWKADYDLESGIFDYLTSISHKS